MKLNYSYKLYIYIYIYSKTNTTDPSSRYSISLTVGNSFSNYTISNTLFYEML